MTAARHLRRDDPCCQIVIPARLASTRLARKLLLAETGKPLIQHTYEAARRSRRCSSVCIAADSLEMVQAVESFGGEVRLTDPDLASGTDRVAAVAREMPDVDIFVNVQGDEPELSPEAVDLVIDLLAGDPSAVMSTVAAPLRDRALLNDPACVKVVFDGAGRALYFSRSLIPHPREWSDERLTAAEPTFFQHLGIYAYRRDFLLELAEMPPSRLEQVERLEQLRVLEAGHTIRVGVVQQASRGIDTPEDYRAFVSRVIRQ